MLCVQPPTIKRKGALTPNQCEPGLAGQGGMGYSINGNIFFLDSILPERAKQRPFPIWAWKKKVGTPW